MIHLNFSTDRRTNSSRTYDSSYINGDVVNAINAEGNEWVASKLVTESENGIVDFGIAFEDSTGNKGFVDSTTDGSYVFVGENDSLVGTVFHDVNLNGVQDDGENGIQTTVSLFTLPLLDTPTNSSGQYYFTDISDGLQTVFVIVPDGFTPYPGTRSYQTILVDGVTTVNFALVSVPLETVTVSINSYGLPVDSALVRLGTQVGITDSDGVVEFQNMLHGTYDILSFSEGYHVSSQSFIVTTSETSVKINLEPINKTIIQPVLGSGVLGCEEDGCYIPITASIDVGGVVIFSNTDNVAHTFTSGTTTGGPDSVFDSGLVIAGQSYQLEAIEVGEFPYFCIIHPWMVGTLTVQNP